MTKEEFINRYGIENYNKQLEYHRQYAKNNKEKANERRRKYCKNHPEKIKEYSKTVKGRAVYLTATYRQNDKYYGRLEDNITADYLVNVLFPKGCIYCGETNPMKLGADRIDNSRGHSADNVVCCCEECNVKRHTQDFTSYLLKRYMERIPNCDQTNVIN